MHWVWSRCLLQFSFWIVLRYLELNYSSATISTDYHAPSFFFISLLYRYSMKIARSRVQLVLNISASSATIVISYTKTSKSRALRHPQHCNTPMDTYITVAVKLIAICDEVVFSLIVAFIVNCNDSYRINCVSCAKLLLTVAHGRQKNNSTEAPCPKVKCD